MLSIILLGACIVRLYRFDNPIADWHSWRQADTSAVSRNFVKNGFDILHPHFDDLSNVASGKDNPHGYRFVEFPLYNLAQAGMFVFFGIFTIEEWGRIVTIISSLLTIIFLYKIVSKYSTKNAGLLTAFFYAFLPFNIYYGRVILPDPSMIMAILGGFYFFDRWIEKTQKEIKLNQDFFLSILFTTSALLLKPYALFFTLPFFYISYVRFGFSGLKKWRLWLYAISALIPLLWWRNWMQQYPEGIPVSNWLFNEGNVRIKRSFYYWIFYERLTKLILGTIGLPLLLFSVGYTIRACIKKYKAYRIFLFFLLSSLLYTIVMAKGNLQHDYYQILIMPTLAMFLGIGVAQIINIKKFRVVILATLIFLILAMFSSSWSLVRDYFNINNHAMITAGKAADKLLPKDAKVIALYNGDTSFLYQTNRQGWTSLQKSLPEMVTMGAQYLILLNPTESDYTGWGKEYTIVSNSAEYLILKLH